MNNNAQLAEYSSNSFKVRGTRAPDAASHQRNLGKSQHAVWGAFQAGMQVLQNYAGRSQANPERIAKANLQLLHQSLLKDPNYSRSLKNASNTGTNSLPSSHCVFENKGLRADLLTLKSGTTIQLKPHQDRYAMYLAITGKPSIQSPDNIISLSKHWWERYRQESHGKLLKNGDAIIMSSNGKAKKLLTAEKKECVLLRVQFANR